MTVREIILARKSQERTGGEMKPDILMSIKPEFAQKILTGEKTVEFRRKFNKDLQFAIVYIYESAPTKMVVGYFVVGGIYRNPPDKAYHSFGGRGCISEERFMQYCNGLDYMYTITILNYKKFDNPIPLSGFGLLRPPQNYQFVKRPEVIVL
jgi:predicted transcriptional regulator